MFILISILTFSLTQFVKVLHIYCTFEVTYFSLLILVFMLRSKSKQLELQLDAQVQIPH